MSDWPKRPVEWIGGDTAYISIPFTWQLPRAWSRCVALRQEGYRVLAGGPAVLNRPDYLRDVAETGGEVAALWRHNPRAVFTSRGCIRQCGFCAVPRTEGYIRELPEWDPKPIVLDNNLLACSRRHFDRVIDRLKGIPGVDFNQGLDARLLSQYHAARIAELDMEVVRLSWDHLDDESAVFGAIERLREAGFGTRRIRVYCLIGYEDTPEDAWYRLDALKASGIRPNPQRYCPSTALSKRYCGPGWTEHKLAGFMHYWARLRWLEHIRFEDFVYRGLPVMP